MKKNMGKTDRIVRVLLSIILTSLYAFNIVEGVMGVLLVILSGIFLLTSFVRVCPLYMPFGIKTNKNEQ